MQKLKGRLLYMGWHNLPWRLETSEGNRDLWPLVEAFLSSINGKRAEQNQESESYELFATDASVFQFSYVPGRRVLLEKTKGFGFSNVYACLDEALVWLSGRLVEVEIEKGRLLHISPDASEQVYKVYFTGKGNSCAVPFDATHSVCKVGTPDCCVFLACNSSGFTCEKFNGIIARILLDRLAEGSIRAKRIGSCSVVGRL